MQIYTTAHTYAYTFIHTHTNTNAYTKECSTISNESLS